MSAKDAKGTLHYKNEEDSPLYFSEWLKQRRQELDLTQEQLALRASCSVFSIRKIETGDRKPSRQLANLLAKSLEISSEDQQTFVKVARGELNLERLSFPVPSLKTDGKPCSIPGNLPRLLTPFIGREPELSTLNQLLRDPQCSLLTIAGSGGIGKTRLAIEAAQRSEDLFPDGIWFISLVSLNTPTQIVPAIADSLKFKFQDPTNLQWQLHHFLREKTALLILDNAEHLLEGVGVFTEILADCPQIKLLVTSRERLNLLSEWVVEIKGLPLPPLEHVEQFESFSSVALFLQSARRVQSGYEIWEDDRHWILKICQAMEGMPLGIELSAAWVGVLSCEAIAREIEQNIDFLSASMRDLPERHRSLRATLDHSWNLLDADERLILSRLSVFQGSFRREAAQEICGANLAVLSSLRNKSLVYRSDRDLYSLHEMIHQYAGLKLAELPDEQGRVKDQHALYYVQCLANWEKALQSSRQLKTFDEMEQVIDNLALGWQHMITSCRTRAGINLKFGADMLHSALFSLSLFYEMRCRSMEAIALLTDSVQYLKTVQAEFEKTEDRDCFLSVLGHITAYLGLHYGYILEYEKSSDCLNEAIQLLEESHCRVKKAQAQIMLAPIYDTQGKLEKSSALLEQSREVFRENNVDWWYLLATTNLALTLINKGKVQECEALFEEGFRLLDPGDLRIGLSLRNGYAYALMGKDPARAEQLMRENLELSYQFGNIRITAYNLFDIGRVAFSTNRIEMAIEYIQQSIDLLYYSKESPDLSLHHLYLGKCFVARQDRVAARDQFRQLLQIEQTLSRDFLVYWGLLCVARLDLEEGHFGKALEITLILNRCQMEYRRIKKDFEDLLVDVRAASPDGLFVAAMIQTEGNISQQQARADLLAYAQEYLNN